MIKGTTQTIENETKEQRCGFLGKLLSTLDANLLGSMLAAKGVIRAGNWVYRLTLKYKSIARINLSLKVFIHKIIYQKLWGLHSKSWWVAVSGAHWIALHTNANSVTYLDSFVVEHIPEKIKRFIGNKSIITNIFRVKTYNSMMHGYFCNRFVDFMFNGKSLTDFRNLFSLHNFKKKDDYFLK